MALKHTSQLLIAPLAIFLGSIIPEKGLAQQISAEVSTPGDFVVRLSPLDPSLSDRTATGVVVVSSSGEHYLLTNAHVIRGVCENGCAVESQGSLELGPTFNAVPPTINTIGNNIEYSEATLDLVIASFVDSSVSYKTPERGVLSNVNEGSISVHGFRSGERVFETIESELISLEQYLDFGECNPPEGSRLIFQSNDESIGFGNGFSGSAILDSNNKLVGIFANSGLDSELNECRISGLGIPMQNILNDDAIGSRLAVLSEQASAGSSQLTAEEDFGNEESSPSSTHRLIQIRRERMSNPGHGGNDTVGND